MTRLSDRLPGSLLALHRAGIVRDLDLYLVETLVRRCAAESTSDDAAVLAALASRAVGDGHVCLDLAKVTPAWLLSLRADREAEVGDLLERVHHACRLPSPVEPEGSEGMLGPPDCGCPMVVSGTRIYLRRYWNYEQLVASRLREMASEISGGEVEPAVGQVLTQILPDPVQQAAARAALTRRLTVVSGGPGTGKTYTAARILYLLLRQRDASSAQVPPTVRMAAPTGKAAARLDETVREAMAGLGEKGVSLLQNVKQACTVDRLLGYVHGSPYFRHDRTHPLRADVLLVDEASMLDLPKTAKLLDGLEPGCRLVLLGDMHQLASVDPGSVLGDLCRSHSLSGCVTELRESRRFLAGSPVAVLSAAVNGAETEEKARAAWRRFEGLDAVALGEKRVQRRDMPDELADRAGAAVPELARAIVQGFGAFTATEAPREAFEALSRFRVLCALRRGPQGADAVNQLIERILSGDAVSGTDIPPAAAGWTRLRAMGEFYKHRVIMVTRNDYSMNLFNGDVGIVLPDDEDASSWVAWFEVKGDADSPGEPGFHKVPCRLLPEHQTAFAMTVHKAQGSEFGHVLVMLPSQDSPVLTRELVYTAVTRTCSGAEIWCNRDVFEHAVRRTADRFTGLLEALDA